MPDDVRGAGEPGRVLVADPGGPLPGGQAVPEAVEVGVAVGEVPGVDDLQLGRLARAQAERHRQSRGPGAAGRARPVRAAHGHPQPPDGLVDRGGAPVPGRGRVDKLQRVRERQRRVGVVELRQHRRGRGGPQRHRAGPGMIGAERVVHQRQPGAAGYPQRAVDVAAEDRAAAIPDRRHAVPADDVLQGAEEPAVQVGAEGVGDPEGEAGQRQSRGLRVERHERRVRLHGDLGRPLVVVHDPGERVGTGERGTADRRPAERPCVAARRVEVVVDERRGLGVRRLQCRHRRLQHAPDRQRRLGRRQPEREERLGQEAQVIPLVVELPLLEHAGRADREVARAQAAEGQGNGPAVPARVGPGAPQPGTGWCGELGHQPGTRWCSELPRGTSWAWSTTRRGANFSPSIRRSSNSAAIRPIS